ncbi:hypothetical protein LQ318_07140 [Aliifodinibius salicampi]|uniref:Uncharacterized protein n=1 Tax=Fodinibius salicampi TaxID=1920655 RepID=A0ABT3PXT5_9BACT|nr:hypothetical protein [Fodinibius salicampi]MCW9712675.1 hypothetical protein [Fodinibius salicampi]
MEKDLLLLELEELGFTILADWINDKEICTLNEALNHLKENEYMLDDEEDERAFRRAEEIVESIFTENAN